MVQESPQRRTPRPASRATNNSHSLGTTAVGIIVAVRSANIAFCSFAWSLERGTTGGRFGETIDAADFDGDGIDDLLLGLPSNGEAGAGRGFFSVYLGKAGYPDGVAVVRVLANITDAGTGHAIEVLGDVDGNGEVEEIRDALYLLQFAFLRGEEPTCLESADIDDSGDVSALLDAIYLLNYGFVDGPAPPDPGPDECGVDPTDDKLDCSEATEDCE